MRVCAASSDASLWPPPYRVDEAYHLDPSDEHVFVMNCLFTLQSPLSNRACAETRAQELRSVGLAAVPTVCQCFRQALHRHSPCRACSAAQDSRLSQLVAVEVGRILAKSGLAEIVDRIKLYQVSASAV